MMMTGKEFWLFAATLLAVVFWLPAVQADDTHGTAEEAQVMAGQAVAYFDEVGAEKAFAKINDDPAPMFLKGDLYVFVIDGGGAIVAHGVDTSLIGVDATELADVDGKKFVQEMLADASMDGTWVDYKWEDPMTGDIEPKSSWVVLHDGYVFGVGIYKP
jgi:signal transduction histidine kinase